MVNHPNRTEQGVSYVVEQIIDSPRGDTGSRYWGEWADRAEAMKEAKRIRHSLVYRTTLVATYRDGRRVKS